MSDRNDFSAESESDLNLPNFTYIDDSRIDPEIIEALRSSNSQVGKRLATNDLRFSTIHFQDSDIGILQGALWSCIVTDNVPTELMKLVENFGRMVVYPTTALVVLAMSNYHSLITEIAEELSENPTGFRGKPRRFGLVQDVIRNHQGPNGIFASKSGDQREAIVVAPLGRQAYLSLRSTHYLQNPGDAILSAIIAGLIHTNSPTVSNLLSLFASGETTKVEDLQEGTYVNFLMPAKMLAYIASHSDIGVTYETLDRKFYSQSLEESEQKSKHFLDQLVKLGFVDKVPLDVEIMFNRDKKAKVNSEHARELQTLMEGYLIKITYSDLKRSVIMMWMKEDSSLSEEIATQRFLDSMKRLKKAGIIEYPSEDAFEAKFEFIITESGREVLQKLEGILSNPISFIENTYDLPLETIDDLRAVLYRILPDGSFREIADMLPVYREAFYALKRFGLSSSSEQ